MPYCIERRSTETRRSFRQYRPFGLFREEKPMWKVLCSALLATALQVPIAHAQTAENSYAGKQINLIVGFNPGGGYDLYSRVAAEWLPRYIPGNPAIVVQNMPGAAGALGANYLYSQASKDGLTI